MKTMHNHTKQTFNNLPQEKRIRILDVAVHEFAEKGYRKASINAIVRNLGIAKGSLYQYFENKEALFLFVFHEFTREVKETVRKAVAPDNAADFFHLITVVLRAGIEFIRSYPAYFQLYLKVLFEEDIPRREELLAEVRLFSYEYFGPLCIASQQGGKIRDDIDAGGIIFIIDAILDRFFQTFTGARTGEKIPGRAKNENKRLDQSIETIMKVLQTGLRAPKS